MKQIIEVKLLPSEYNSEQILQKASSHLAVKSSRITGVNRLKVSLDARGSAVYYRARVEVFVDEPFVVRKINPLNLQSVEGAKQAIVVGCGPAGLFAALRLIELGIKPIILERGKAVKERRRDLAALTRNRQLNEDSNYCFGEGGAGTFSDGKLYTRSGKRGSIDRILGILVYHGADERILYDAHPHIGTNKLPGLISRIRENILKCGGEVRFNSRVTNILIENGVCKGVEINNLEKINGVGVILATGHSARDVYEMLNRSKVELHAKPFAIGLRIEHEQKLIDQAQYHCKERDPLLPPASYSLVHQSAGGGVFSFCMCPGGIIAPAMTQPQSIVVNGWSPSKRNNKYANSGIVTSVDVPDFKKYTHEGALAGLKFQGAIEHKAFVAGGNDLSAPAQRLTDFLRNKFSSSLPDTSYFLGVKSSLLSEVLPKRINEDLVQGLKAFGKKMKGYVTENAILVGVESRTSAPVRIPRDKESLEHTQVKGLYPCGEGAGYAGGIVSAAMDGERCAEALFQKVKSNA